VNTPFSSSRISRRRQHRPKDRAIEKPTLSCREKLANLLCLYTNGRIRVSSSVGRSMMMFLPSASHRMIYRVSAMLSSIDLISAELTSLYSSVRLKWSALYLVDDKPTHRILSIVSYNQ
jgi:hypothetical protein